MLREKVGTEKDYLIHDLSDIAWLLNLRGRDIPYNPVFVAFLLFLNRENRFVLFTHGETLTPTNCVLTICKFFLLQFVV